jgi:HlyD family secretion protein
LRVNPDTATGGAGATTTGGRNASTTATTETTSAQTASTSTGPPSDDRAARWRNRQNGQTSTSTAGGMSPEERAARWGNRTAGVAGAAAGLGAAPAPRKRPQTVYLLGADNKLTAVEIRTGITDGHYTQVVSGDLKPGDNVIIGLATSKMDTNAPPGSAGPMGGARPGGGGGGRGGR